MRWRCYRCVVCINKSTLYGGVAAVWRWRDSAIFNAIKAYKMLSQVVDKNRGCLWQKCRGVYWGLREALGENELSFRTVARLIKAFCAGPNNTVDLHRKGRTYNSKDKIDIENGIFSIDRRWTLRELSVDLVSGADAVCTMTLLRYQ